MVEISGYAPGTPCWTELDSPNATASKEFYEELFGWNSYVYTSDKYGEYRTWTLGPHHLEVCGLLALVDDTQPPSWTCHFAVDDLGSAIERVRAAGGQITVDATDLENVGRFVLAVDQEGADFVLWKGYDFPGAGVMTEPGSLCWMELACRDLEQAQRFYGDVLGWTFVPRDHDGLTYSNVKVADRSVAGMVVLDERLRPFDRPQWMPYFAVDDCDTIVTKATELGAGVDVAPRDIRSGRYALLKDPLGAPLAVIKPVDDRGSPAPR